MNRKLITGVSVAAFALAVFLYAHQAHATAYTVSTGATVHADYINGSNTLYATAIDNITIQGTNTIYDINFVSLSPSDQLSTLNPPGVNIEAVMTAAATDLNLAEQLAPSNSIEDVYNGTYAGSIAAPAQGYGFYFYDDDISPLATQSWAPVYPVYCNATTQPSTWQVYQSHPLDPPDGNWGVNTSESFALVSIAAPESPVPEPNTAALFLVGLGLIGFIGLRRKFKGQTHIA